MKFQYKSNVNINTQDFNKKKSALICGISGQDGAYLAQLLLQKGYTVFGSSRDAETANFKNLHHLGIFEKITKLSIAVSDFRSVLHALKLINPDEIYNLAGQTSVGLSFEQPVETFDSITVGTINFLEAIRLLDVKTKYYNAASSECFGNTENLPANEKTPFRPRSPYAVAKAAAFWQVANYREAYDLFACSGILFNHESILRPSRFVTQKIITAVHQIQQGKQHNLYLGNLSIQRDWGWAPDFVKAMWLMLQQESPEDFVIGTGHTHSLQYFVELAFSCAHLNWKEHVIQDSLFIRPTELEISMCDPSKAQEKLGWHAEVPIDEIVKRLYQSKGLA
jgi:GDPmannose 4,6-dehydratase